VHSRLVTLLPREDLISWGWRLPFLASFLLIMVGIYVRLKVTETPVFTQAVVARGKIERNPAMEALKRHPRNFFVVLGARLAENGLGYLFPVFGLSYVVTTLGVPRADALSALMLAFVIELVRHHGVCCAFRPQSDDGRSICSAHSPASCGRSRSSSWSAPRSWIWIAVAFIGARAVVTAAMFGPQAAYFAELFPAAAAFAGFAFARELGSLLAGGPAAVSWQRRCWRGREAGGRSPATRPSSRRAPRLRSGAVPKLMSESITVDNTMDGVAMRSAAMPSRA